MAKAKTTKTTTAKEPAVKKACASKCATTKTCTKAADKGTTRVTFTVRAEPGSKVFIAGAFNDWDPTAKELVDKKNDGLFSCILCLPKGSYEYKFVINGTWCADPECTDWVQNSMGTLNSVKIVG